MDKILEKATALKSSIFITKTDLGYFIMGIMGFFLGRVILLQFLSPAAMPFLSVFLFSGYRFYLVLCFTLIGLFTKLEGAFFMKYLLAAGIITVAQIILRKRKKSAFPIEAIVCGGSILFSGLLFSFLYGFSLYFASMAVMESFLAASITYIIKKAVAMLDGTVKRKVLNNEELISLALLMACVISGSADVYLGGFSMMYLMLTLVLLVVSYRCGAAYGAAAGVTLGFIMILTNNGDLNLLGILSIAALVSGIFKRFNKLGSILGFIAGGLAVSLYLNRSFLTKDLLLSVAFGAGIFAFLPENFYFSMDSLMGVNVDITEEYLEKVSVITTAKLHGFSNSFDRLAKTLNGLSQKKVSLNQEDISKLIDDAAAKVCEDCPKKEDCWQVNFYRTYQAAVSMLAACENKMHVSSEDIPADFKNSCVQLNFFAESIARIFEIYKTNLIWSNKMIESRELVCLQLTSVSKILGTLADEINFDINFKTSLEESIMLELKKNKIEVENVMVLENKLGQYEVTVNHNNCGRKRICVKDIIPIVSSVLGRKMKQDESFCDVTPDICRLHLSEEQRLRISCAVARAVKDESSQSGDSYSFMELKRGQCLLALSDGMGSGIRARTESAAVVELLEEFIESGFDREMAVKMINSVLVLKNEDESFSTLDICSMDLHTGIAEFIKIGAASTFVIRDRQVNTVKSASLPMGILNTVDLEVSVKKLKHNDIILMMTDGVLDTFENITHFLRELKYVNPQDIADKVLEEAKRLSENELRDDMTVLAARVWEKV